MKKILKKTKQALNKLKPKQSVGTKVMKKISAVLASLTIVAMLAPVQFVSAVDEINGTVSIPLDGITDGSPTPIEFSFNLKESSSGTPSSGTVTMATQPVNGDWAFLPDVFTFWFYVGTLGVDCPIAEDIVCVEVGADLAASQANFVTAANADGTFTVGVFGESTPNEATFAYATVGNNDTPAWSGDGKAVISALTGGTDPVIVQSDLNEGDKIVIDIPDTFGNFGSLSAANVSITTDDLGINDTDSAYHFNDLMNRITYTLPINASAVAATADSVETNGVHFVADIAGEAANGVNLVLADDDITDCNAETPASLAALIIGSSPNFTLTCDLDDSLNAGASQVTGTRLAAAIQDGTTTTIDDVINASPLGTGDDVITAQLPITLAGGSDSVTGETADTGETITVYIDNVLSLPTDSGQTAIFLATTDSNGTVFQSGVVILNHDNTVTINAHVAEALVMTLDSTLINILVDPSVNNGEDYSQKTEISVKTNADNGYRILASLEGDTGVANLTNGSDAIPAGDAYTDERQFGYLAFNCSLGTNGDDCSAEIFDQAGLKTQITTFGDNDTEAFVYNAAGEDLLEIDGLTSIGRSGVTNLTKHLVYYVVNVDYLQPAGDYTGTVTYTALPSF